MKNFLFIVVYTFFLKKNWLYRNFLLTHESEPRSIPNLFSTLPEATVDHKDLSNCKISEDEIDEEGSRHSIQKVSSLVFLILSGTKVGTASEK